MGSRSRLSPALLFSIATAFGLSSSVQSYLLSAVSGDRVEDQALHILKLLALNLVYWYVPALLAPAIMSGAMRVQFGRGRVLLPVLVHAGGALLYSVVHGAAMLGTRMLLMQQQSPRRGWWFAAQVEYLTQLDWTLMTYLFLVGLAHALAYRRESERRAIDAAQLETRLLEAQLQSLQRQLQPHFLFNTLNAISGLMRTDVEAADRMMDGLGDLLRISLRSAHVQEVPLKDELEMLQKYLDIEQVRFGARLTVTMRIDPDTLSALVPNFLLQPLVENAVRHGIAPHTRPGRIDIEARREGERLSLAIRDSGDGVAAHYLTLLNTGVGLTNTRTRLERLYRSDHAFVFTNDGGFCVTVTIPFIVDRAAEPVRVGAA